MTYVAPIPYSLDTAPVSAALVGTYFLSTSVTINMVDSITLSVCRVGTYLPVLDGPVTSKQICKFKFHLWSPSYPNATSFRINDAGQHVTCIDFLKNTWWHTVPQYHEHWLRVKPQLSCESIFDIILRIKYLLKVFFDGMNTFTMIRRKTQTLSPTNLYIMVIFNVVTIFSWKNITMTHK